MQKRLQNQLYVGYPLGTLKNTILDVKTSPRWRPKISNFFQKSSKNASYHGLWSKMPLGSLQEPAKSLPRASQEPSQSPQEALHSLEEPPIRPQAGSMSLATLDRRGANVSGSAWTPRDLHMGDYLADCIPSRLLIP